MKRYENDPRWQPIYGTLLDYSKVSPEEMTVDIIDALDEMEAQKIVRRK